eukprot:SAG11_NODE_1638_length_4535_cov_3.231740_1_plen_745_part_00
MGGPAEKRRVQRRKEEKRQGLAPGALTPEGAGGGHHLGGGDGGGKATGAYVPPSRRGGGTGRPPIGGQRAGPEHQQQQQQQHRGGGRQGEEAPCGHGQVANAETKKKRSGRKRGGGGGGGGGGGNALQSGGSRAGGEGTKQMNSTLRRNADQGNIGAVIRDVEAMQTSADARLDASAATAVLNAYAKSGKFEGLPALCALMKESGCWFKLDNLAAALGKLSQFTVTNVATGDEGPFGSNMQTVMLGGPRSSELADAMVAYGVRFMRLVTMELLEESHGAIQRRNQPRGKLEDEGVSRGGLVFADGCKPNKWRLRSSYSTGGFTQRSIKTGDIVLVTRDDGGYDSVDGPTLHPSIPAGQYPFEAKVQTMQLYQGSCSVDISPTIPHSPPPHVGAWRIDKLGNGQVYDRQIEALKRIVLGNAKVDPDIQAIIAGSDAADGVGLRGADLEARCAAEVGAGAGAEELSEAEQAYRDEVVRSRQRYGGAAMGLPKPIDLQQLNESQRRAQEAAMVRRLTLIQGPPGAGKTKTAVAIVVAWCRNRVSQGPVMVCGDSNTAVDNLAEGIAAQGIQVARVAKASAVKESLQGMVCDVAGPDAKGAKKQLAAAECVLVTCAGAGSSTFDRMRFTHVLIDEAGQATEPMTLIPITRGCRQLVLVGDHHQLPPTVVSKQAEREGLAYSLFGRLADAGARTFLLDTQYRMHPVIADFPVRSAQEPPAPPAPPRPASPSLSVSLSLLALFVARWHSL